MIASHALVIVLVILGKSVPFLQVTQSSTEWKASVVAQCSVTQAKYQEFVLKGLDSIGLRCDCQDELKN